MERDSVRKTFTYRLQPTPQQARMLAVVVWRCRELYNAGLAERKGAWETGGVSATFARQSAQLPASKEVRPEYREIHAQVLQDVLHRLDKAFQAFFRRVQAGEKSGYPRFQGRARFHSFTSPQVGKHGGARLDNGCLVLAKVGHTAMHWSRPLEGTPQDRHDLA
jgi:putative transposase